MLRWRNPGALKRVLGLLPTSRPGIATTASIPLSLGWMGGNALSVTMRALGSSLVGNHLKCLRFKFYDNLVRKHHFKQHLCDLSRLQVNTLSRRSAVRYWLFYTWLNYVLWFNVWPARNRLLATCSHIWCTNSFKFFEPSGNWTWLWVDLACLLDLRYLSYYYSL